MSHRNKYHRYTLAAAAVLLMASLSSCPARGTSGQNHAAQKEVSPLPSILAASETQGFDTPEDAVAAYLEGLKAADLDAMMSTYAVEIYVDHYDFKAQLERLQGYHPTQETKLPNNNALSRSLNIESRKNAISNSILNHYMLLCYAELERETTLILREEGEAETFYSDLAGKLDTTSFDSITLLGFISPGDMAEQYNSESNQENLDRLAQICGADKLSSCIAVFERNGNKYMLCSDAALYDNQWYLLQANGNISSLLGIRPIFSGMIPVDAEFSAAIESYMTPARQTEQDRL